MWWIIVRAVKESHLSKVKLKLVAAREKLLLVLLAQAWEIWIKLLVFQRQVYQIIDGALELSSFYVHIFFLNLDKEFEDILANPGMKTSGQPCYKYTRQKSTSNETISYNDVKTIVKGPPGTEPQGMI